VIASPAHSSFQPQSQAITFASMLAPRTARSIVAFTSAMISAGLRFEHRGQAASL
jgi:hypothetical protein